MEQLGRAFEDQVRRTPDACLNGWAKEDHLREVERRVNQVAYALTARGGDRRRQVS
jgi:hypothetical protein